MAAVWTLSSRPELHILPSSVQLACSPNYASDIDSTCGLVGTSPRSNAVFENSGFDSSSESVQDSSGIVNGGYYSPDSIRRCHLMQVILDPDKAVEEYEENKSSRVARATESRSDGVCPSTTENNVKFVEIVRKPSARSWTGPQNLVRLKRPKSSSDQPILNQNRKESEEATDSNPKDVDNTNTKHLYVSTLDVSEKRGGYFHKVSALFKRRSSKNLSKLASQSIEELSRHVTSKINTTDFKKCRSQTFISDISTNGNSGELNKLRDTDTLGSFKEVTRKVEGEDEDICNSHVEEAIRAELTENGVQRRDSREDTTHLTSQIKYDRLERSYSLIRRDSKQNDTSHVNVTRMPSIRRRKVHPILLYHFTTTHPPESTTDIYVIREGTHVQPLDDGNAMVTDTLSNSMVLFNSKGHPKVTFSFESGSEPWAICLTPERNLAVTLKRQGCVSLWTMAGEPVSEFGHNVLLGPAGIQCDHQGRFIVADEQANSVCIFNSQGEFITKLGSLDVDDVTQVKTPHQTSISNSYFNQPRYVCMNNFGNCVITDSANHCVKIFDQDMQFLHQFGKYGRQDDCFKFPYGVACDGEDNLYVADHFNNRISLFSPGGEFVEHVLTSQDGIARPKSLAIKHSLLYVTHGHLRSSKVSVFKLMR